MGEKCKSVENGEKREERWGLSEKKVEERYNFGRKRSGWREGKARKWIDDDIKGGLGRWRESAEKEGRKEGRREEAGV